MTTTLLLVRHAACEQMAEALVGRGADVPLTPYGLKQLDALAQVFAQEQASGTATATVYCSPRRRARMTAEAIARAASCELQADEHVDEVNFGEWTGRSFEALNEDPRWRMWNQQRSRARAPNGESMLDVQRRIVNRIEALAAQHRDARIVVVTHSEIIRTLLLHYLQLPLDAYSRLEISPAGRSSLQLDEWSVKITSINEQVAA